MWVLVALLCSFECMGHSGLGAASSYRGGRAGYVVLLGVVLRVSYFMAVGSVM